MTAFVNHLSFEFRTGLRDKSLMLLNYFFPLGFYVLMGLLMIPINPGFRETIIPSLVVFAILSGMILGLPNPLVAAREAGVFRSFKINGVPAISILVVPALSTILHVAVAAAIIALSAPFLFDAPPPQNWFGFVLVFLATAVAAAGLGVLIGVIAADSRSIVLWSQLIYLPSMMLGGLMFPTSLLPATLAPVAWLLPATYAMAGFQGLAQGQSVPFNPLWAVVILVAGGVLAFALAVYLFNWDNRNVTRRGHPLLALLAILPYVLGSLLLR